MNFKPPSLPLPEKSVKHPVYITKAISLDKICFRLIDKMDKYVVMFKGLQSYYFRNTGIFIDSKSVSEGSITDDLFILMRDNVYHRVKVLEIWPNKSFLVRLIDEGFETIATENELLVNTNDEYLIEPSQGFTLPLRIDQSLNTKKILYIINYGLQKMASSKTDFFISLSSDNKINLFYKDQKQNLVSVNDFVTEYIKQKENKELIVSSSHAEVVTNGTLSKTKVNGVVNDYKEKAMKCKYVFNPNHFYLKLPKDKEFNGFLEDMNEFCERNSKHASNIGVNKLYVTNYNGQWTRLLILNILKENSGKEHYSCLLVDKGVIGTINKEDIFDLDDRFKLEPHRSFKSSLAFTKPVQEKWTKEACQFFRQKVKDNLFTVYPLTKGMDGTFYCFLVKDNESITDLLVLKEYALVDL